MFRKVLDSILAFSLSNSNTMDQAHLSQVDLTNGKNTSAISSSTRINLFQYLDSLARDNYIYYKAYSEDVPDDASKCAEVLSVIERMRGHIPETDKLCEVISQSAMLFDAIPEVEGNGYRSLLSVLDACILKLLELNIHMKDSRETFYFRRSHCLEGIRDFTEILGTLRAILKYAVRILEMEKEAGTRNLFCGHGSELLEEWLVDVETLNQTAFYGNCTAFYLCSSIRAAMYTITTALAAFAEKYIAMEEANPGSGSLALGSLGENLLASRKFILDQNLKAKQLVSATRDLDIRFCKAFWSIAESRFWQPVLWWMLPKMEVCREFAIQPETFDLPRTNPTETITICPPKVHLGERALPVRILSARVREGQLFIDENDTAASFKFPDKVLTKSDYLVMHLHGGGFVAQSFKSCDIYVREWAAHLTVPVFSVDYTLAPEGPYPRAVEEVFYAYCWALKNCHKLGWTGKRIVLAGDSAGGNLVFGIAFKAFREGIRMPDGILTIYAPFLTRYTPSPSRILSLMDPLIPIGILTRCLAAYAGLSESDKPTDVVQSATNLPEDSSPSDGSSKSWDELSLTELSGAELLDSASPSSTEEQNGELSNMKDQGGAHTKGQHKNGFPMHLPTGGHIFGLARPVTSRVSRQISRMSSVVSQGYNTIRDLIGPRAESQRSRRPSIVNPNAPWIKMMNPLKRYDFDSLPIDDPLLSPLQADDNLIKALPPCSLIAAHMDPCLDDSVAMARRLYQSNKTMTLDLVPHLPHGFLNFVMVSKEACEANRLVIQRLRELLRFEA